MLLEEALQQFAAYIGSHAQPGLYQFALICHEEALNGLNLTRDIGLPTCAFALTHATPDLLLPRRADQLHLCCDVL